eukprot:TRINITY_DN67339_c1_g1_i7.p1 TRINITY_DN67339_c1_g1~~TRINITY_DN67339_c1_g1_i7.p1  ORF type:complete len:253 (+),score=45.29 TRINITY_DN67339_c1_g1_i7:305-1063(+)
MLQVFIMTKGGNPSDAQTAPLEELISLYHHRTTLYRYMHHQTSSVYKKQAPLPYPQWMIEVELAGGKLNDGKNLYYDNNKPWYSKMKRLNGRSIKAINGEKRWGILKKGGNWPLAKYLPATKFLVAWVASGGDGPIPPPPPPPPPGESCPNPGVPEHGAIKGNPSFPVANGGRISYHCDEGYAVHGAKAIRCQNGQWSDPVPTCEPIPDECHYGQWGQWEECVGDKQKRYRELISGDPEVCKDTYCYKCCKD